MDHCFHRCGPGGPPRLWRRNSSDPRDAARRQRPHRKSPDCAWPRGNGSPLRTPIARVDPGWLGHLLDALPEHRRGCGERPAGFWLAPALGLIQSFGDQIR